MKTFDSFIFRGAVVALALSFGFSAPCVFAQTKGAGFSSERSEFTTPPPPAKTEKKVDSSTSLLDDIQRKAESLGTYSQASLGHTLGEGDVVEVKVYQEDELTTKARVDSQGKISMPLLGAIPVGGQSIETAQNQIRALLEKDYLRAPQVSMTLVEFAKKRYSVLGEVNQPGFFLIPEGESMSVLQAIATAGGFTPYARSGEIILKRKINGREETLRIDAKAMAKKKLAPTLNIQGGDVIYVNQSVF